MSHYTVKLFFSSAAAAAVDVLAVAFAAPASADPPPAPDCVQDNGLSCLAALSDLNAACERDPVACLFAYVALAGQLDADSS